MKIMLLVLYKSNEAISKVIESNIFHQIFFIHMSFKRAVITNIDVKQIRSCDNLADLLTKTLPTAIFKKLVHDIGIVQLKNLSL